MEDLIERATWGRPLLHGRRIRERSRTAIFVVAISNPEQVM
jgi:hypothetical protein